MVFMTRETNKIAPKLGDVDHRERVQFYRLNSFKYVFNYFLSSTVNCIFPTIYKVDNVADSGKSKINAAKKLSPAGIEPRTCGDLI